MRALALALATTLLAGTASAGAPDQVTNIFKPLSTPAESVYEVALARAGRLRRHLPRRRRAARLHHRPLPPPCADDGTEPPQIYGSNQIELAWTVFPILIVLRADSGDVAHDR